MSYSARSGNGIVFFDLCQDDYYCEYLYEPLGDYRGNATMRVCSERSADDVPLKENPWMAAPRPSKDARPLDVVRFLAALVETSIVFRHASVRDMLCHVSERSLPLADLQTAADIAHVYRDLLMVMPLRRECLFKSFLLMNFLRRYGVTAEWVFGVHLFPFRAHCWIAVGPYLLSERPHRIEDYQTILTFGRHE
jgi:hypothetical protein